MDVPENLRQCPLFAGIEAADLAGMLQCLGARRVRCERGGTILAEGMEAREVGILTSGRAQLVRTDYYGNRSIMLHIAPGQLFAESFACAGAERLPVSVLAVEDCEALLVECRRLLTPCCQACAFHSRVIFNLLRIVAEKNLLLHRRDAGDRLVGDACSSMLAYLLMAAKEAGRADFTIPFDRQGLADYLEVDRSGLSQVLSQLKREGVLDYSRSRFCLHHLPEGAV